MQLRDDWKVTPDPGRLGSSLSPVGKGRISRRYSWRLATCVGSFPTRHMFMARMNDRIPTTRLAEMTRTSVGMIENVYGRQSDESFAALLEKHSAEIDETQA